MGWKHKDKACWGLGYLLVVVIYSGAYYSVWCISPDGFIVNSELNKYPLSRAFNYIGGSSTVVNGVPALPGLVEFSQELDEKDNEMRALNAEIYNGDRKVEQLRAEQEKLGSQNQVLMASKILEYQNKQVAQANIDVVEAERGLGIYESGLTDLEKESDKYRMVIAYKKVDLADLKVIAAKKAEEAANYILKNMSRFSDPGIASRLSVVSQDIQRSWVEREQKVEKLHGLIDSQSSRLGSWREQRASMLSWYDFLFFSIGISTTTTYGDLVGNSRFVRFAIASQLFLCIFIMAGFVSSVVSSGAKKDR